MMERKMKQAGTVFGEKTERLNKTVGWAVGEEMRRLEDLSIGIQDWNKGEEKD